jgi:hypothetical protein
MPEVTIPFSHAILAIVNPKRRQIPSTQIGCRTNTSRRVSLWELAPYGTGTTATSLAALCPAHQQDRCSGHQGWKQGEAAGKDEIKQGRA